MMALTFPSKPVGCSLTGTSLVLDASTRLPRDRMRLRRFSALRENGRECLSLFLAVGEPEQNHTEEDVQQQIRPFVPGRINRAGRGPRQRDQRPPDRVQR